VDIGFVTVANGVVYAPSTGAANPSSTPNMFALDAATGEVLWSFPSGGSVAAGAVVVNGTVYWGSGYGRLGFVGGQNKFFAFSLAANRSREQLKITPYSPHERGAGAETERPAALGGS